MKNTLLLTLALVLWALTGIGQNIDPPIVDCISTDEINGDVDISWTNPTPNACGAFVEYQIWGDAGSGFVLVSSIPDQTQVAYTHVGANGTLIDWCYYMVAIHNCPGSVSLQSATICEKVLPIPEIDYVTVNAAGEVEVYWLPPGPPADDPTSAIEVLTIDEVTGFAQPLGVSPVANVPFNDALSDPSSGRIVYTVKGLDDCDNRTANSDMPHQTIFLGVTSSACDQEIEITWNRYINWPNNEVAEYRLEIAIDGGAPTIDQTVAGTVFDPTLPNDVRQTLIRATSDLVGTNICFRMLAVHPVDQTKISASNQICIPLSQIQSTSYTHLRTLTVNPAGGVDLSFYADINADITQFVVDGGPDPANPDDRDTIDVTGAVPNIVDFTDPDVLQTSMFSYGYEAISEDVCDFSVGSGVGQTILLQGQINQAAINSLSWSPFVMPNATILNYRIIQKVNNVEVPIETLLPDQLAYDHLVGDVQSDNGVFCYCIETDYLLNLPDIGVLESLTSRSNETCLEQDPVIYIPNAFVPGGINTNFKPVLLFGVEQYEFHIYDRWGKELFFTENLIAGWDGTDRGERLPTDGYVYYIKVVSTGGITVEKRGVVALIR